MIIQSVLRSSIVHGTARRAIPISKRRQWPAIQTTPTIPPTRPFANNSTVDEKIEEIQEIYATAKDEFEIASEETDKKTVYAEEDRQAAAEELGKLRSAFEEAVKGDGGDEIKRRVGQRIRELDQAVKAMEERAMED